MTARFAVALITGAGSGLGRQLALDLAAQGVAIAAIDCVAEGLASVEAEIGKLGGRVACACADVTDFQALQKKIIELETRLGAADLVIANAGIGIETSALKLSAGDVTRVLQINLIGVTNTIAAVLPGMIERRQGHVVAISSIAGLRGMPRMLAYCASKAGVNTFMEALRLEVAPYGIHATTICPGWIKTPMTAPFDMPMPARISVGQASASILRAIRARKKLYAFPARVAWPVRMIGVLPLSVQDLIFGYLTRSTVPADITRKKA